MGPRKMFVRRRIRTIELGRCSLSSLVARMVAGRFARLAARRWSLVGRMLSRSSELEQSTMRFRS